MKNMTYNGMEFSIVKMSSGWDISRKLPNGEVAVVASTLFVDLPDSEAELRAQALIRIIFPVGIKVVGPDVAHPNRVGDLKIIGPDVVHPNFVYWNSESTSFAK